MSLITVAAVLLALWVGLLTIVLLVLVREVAILRARMDLRGAGFAVDADGLDVGRPLADEAVAQLPQLGSTGPTYVVLLSAICAPCRELATQLSAARPQAPLVVLVTGRAEIAQGIVAALPPFAQVVEDPSATAIAELLQVKSVPFAFEIEDRHVSGKAYLRSVADLNRLAAARLDGTRNLARPNREVVQHASAD